MKSAPDAAVVRLRRLPGGPLVLRLVSDLARSEIADRSMTLAGQAFTSILPVMIVLSTIPGNGVIDQTLDGYGLSAADLALTSGDAGDAAVTFGVVGALMTIISATSFSRALDRMYSRVWDVPKLRFSEGWRWIVVILTVAFGAAAQSLIANIRDLDGLRGLFGLVLEVSAGLAFWTLLWFGICRLLTRGRVNIRCGILTGMLTAVGMTALAIGSHIALDPILHSATEQFGVLGTIFTVISWLFVFSAIVIAAAVIVHALAADSGAIGRWLGTPDLAAAAVSDGLDSAAPA